MWKDGADLTGLRFLIVEDEFLLAMDLKIFLQQRGCMVLGPVPSVGQALRMLNDEQPDIALLDINLKGERVRLSPRSCRPVACHMC